MRRLAFRRLQGLDYFCGFLGIAHRMSIYHDVDRNQSATIQRSAIPCFVAPYPVAQSRPAIPAPYCKKEKSAGAPPRRAADTQNKSIDN